MKFLCIIYTTEGPCMQRPDGTFDKNISHNNGSFSSALWGSALRAEGKAAKRRDALFLEQTQPRRFRIM